MWAQVQLQKCGVQSVTRCGGGGATDATNGSLHPASINKLGLAIPLASAPACISKRPPLIPSPPLTPSAPPRHLCRVACPWGLPSPPHFPLSLRIHAAPSPLSLSTCVWWRAHVSHSFRQAAYLKLSIPSACRAGES